MYCIVEVGKGEGRERGEREECVCVVYTETPKMSVYFESTILLLTRIIRDDVQSLL